MSAILDSMISGLQQWDPQWVDAVLLLVCFSAAVVMLRLFGKAGLYVYMAVAIIGANIQVLKIVKFGFMAEPVALGTVLFSTTFLVTDILTEHYGKAAARKAVWLGFAAMLLWTAVATLTLGYAPLTAEQAGEGLAWATETHGHMAALFTPFPQILVASLISYAISQTHDVWLYDLIRRVTGGRKLWLRNNVATIASALLDNIVFSTLAWVVLADEPVGLQTLVFTYILGTFWIRVIVALLDTPFLYLARRVSPPDLTPAPLPAAAE